MHNLEYEAEKEQEQKERATFEEALEKLLNQYSKENYSDTPDFILAKYISACLEAYNQTVTARDKWFGVDMWATDKIAK